MRLPESVTKIQPVGAVLKASEAGEALLSDAIARQKGAHLTITAMPCAALALEGAERLHGGVLEIAWGEIAEG